MTQSLSLQRVWFPSSLTLHKCKARAGVLLQCNSHMTVDMSFSQAVTCSCADCTGLAMSRDGG